MKRCPECRRDYYDDTLLYCLEDGNALFQGSVPSPDEPATAILSEPGAIATGFPPDEPLAALVVAVLVLVGGFFGYRYFSTASSKQVSSIAVMPFENRNSDADTDYLSDGLAESVIFRLTQIPDLKVSPTSSVMRYKKEHPLILQRSRPNLA